MHACGHDVHMASLLGCIRILNEMRDGSVAALNLFSSPVKRKFRVARSSCLRKTVLAGDEPELMIAQHVYPEMQVGKVGFREGQYMASSDEIYITVKGKGGHAALPEKLIDPVL